jgi:hypothetical protein
MMNVIQPPHPVLDKRGEPHVRRFEEQRWLIDNIIRANGIDWDQPRSLYLSGPCGNEANADFAGIRERVKKPARSQGAGGRASRAQGHRARQLLHGRGALGRRAMAL